MLVFHDVSESARAAARSCPTRRATTRSPASINRREFERAPQRGARSARARETVSYALLLPRPRPVQDRQRHLRPQRRRPRCSSRSRALLQTTMRATDTLARLGGDEFGVLLADCALDAGASASPSTLRETIRDYRFVWEERAFERRRAASAWCRSPATAKTSRAVLSAADVACYAAKDAGPQPRPHLPARTTST
ncbi:MAG: diguanylate cyclase [Chromatiales bacterium]|nr:diguanylate cyclase [Chromatiales bacterium]